MAMRTTPFWEDVDTGDELPTLRKGPMTTTHLVRWSAAIENWHKIHYDAPYTQEREKLPGLLVNGSVKQQFVMQLLKDWAGPAGWVWKANLQFRAMNVVGETLDVWGRVTRKHDAADFGLVDIEFGIRNEHGIESTPGQATVALPYRDGGAVPYPFVPPL
jgi:hydroxyacyl-ACP dehydratase HTD2-like protein with hotdog domain